MTTISFHPLQKSHFSLLFKWLKAPHIKVWWDHEIEWTSQKIEEKYESYVKGYKREKGSCKKIQAYIISFDATPIGYIQLYNAYDFPRTPPLTGLPESMAAFDFFIGESQYCQKGIGPLVLKLFLEKFCESQFKAVFAAPNIKNIAAIKAYEKAGFRKVNDNLGTDEIWMLRSFYT